MRHPILSLAWRLAHTNRALRQELSAEKNRRMAVEVRLGVAMRDRDQARRDAECIALMAKDRGVALSFLRDQHRIEQLPEVS